MNANLAENLEIVRSKIAAAARRTGRSISQIDLLAVTKFVSLEVMEHAYQLGICKFGESYVQEALPKIAAFSGRNPAVEFNLVGKLQQNKVKRAVGNFSLIQSIDRPELLRSVATIARNRAIVQNVLIQVNISHETTKGGVDLFNVDDFVELTLRENSIELVGLMSYGTALRDESNGSNEYQLRTEFSAMREAIDRLRRKFQRPFPILSMGTSEDFEIAIEEGATQVRVGSALFGDRY